MFAAAKWASGMAGEPVGRLQWHCERGGRPGLGMGVSGWDSQLARMVRAGCGSFDTEVAGRPTGVDGIGMAAV